MRIAGILVLCAALAGCKGKSDASNTPDPAALKAQQELIARRDALLAQRQQLQSDADKVAEEIKAAEAKGGDTSALAKKKADLEKQMQGQDAELATIRTNVETAVAKIAAAGDAAALIAQREANMGSRERSVAVREEKMADRERSLAQRERELAQREKDTCGAAQPMIVQQVAAPRGANYTRKEIEPLLNRARSQMSKKGILGNDLGPASGLEGEATKAMADGDWGKAYLAAAQLSATVDAIKIDRSFITAKYARLNTRVSSGKLDEQTSQQLTDGMKDVLQKYGDGDFAAANRKLNQLWALGGIR
jgi:hypothetical protein